MSRYSRISTFSLLFTLLLWALIGTTSAQEPRIVNVAPTEFGILNKTIDGDTTATGARVDTNTVYVLQRGEAAFYLLDGSIENRFPLTIIAEDGPGEKPKLVPGVVSGGESARAFVPRADLTLKGIYVSGVDNAGGLQKNMLRVRADDARIVIEDCHLDYDSQSIFRLDNPGISIFMKNSIMSNVGQTVSPDNGRGIDDRGNNIDSLVVENCTFYNITSRVLRDGGGYINYLKFNHNTMINIGQHIMTPGEVVEFEFTNNVIINGDFLGNSVNLEEPAYAIETAPLTNDDVVGLTQSMNIRNNNIYLDQVIIDAYPDSVIVADTFDSLAQSFIDAAETGETIISEALAFTNGPATPTDVMLGIYVDNQATADPSAPPFDTGNVPDFGQPGFGVMPFDLSYPETAVSYVSSIASQPLGDLTWFGLDIETAVKFDSDKLASAPNSFKLLGNYPNPFNPTTQIAYDLAKQSHVTLTIYNTIGQKIATLFDNVQQAGSHHISWNGRSDAGKQMPSGVYMYRLDAEGATQTMKMIMMK